jgi:hypothetical protein
MVELLPTGFPMRALSMSLVLFLALAAPAAELESRRLTHYVPQDFLETVVRTEGWTEVVLAVKGGIRKGDTVRIWAGGSIDRGNGDQPGENVGGPTGVAATAADETRMALSTQTGHAYALLVKSEAPLQGFDLLFKSETTIVKKCAAAGKPLELPMTGDGQKIWIGFNDERGRYADNHLGKGRRHELDPLWVRIEVVRITVD